MVSEEDVQFVLNEFKLYSYYDKKRKNAIKLKEKIEYEMQGVHSPSFDSSRGSGGIPREQKLLLQSNRKDEIEEYIQNIKNYELKLSSSILIKLKDSIIISFIASHYINGDEIKTFLNNSPYNTESAILKVTKQVISKNIPSSIIVELKKQKEIVEQSITNLERRSR
jgi:hypothetical protein